ncbi:MAG: peptidoglycan DD-metalloendopeptidase family protein [Rhodothermales bacterium]|nr:peptidoglycan DD-metalloendopeptidase family protein [Rhodothermales bacterium]MBO6780253.1 peptidoglycan DD-metalloendopeptidase family protein [Rhodothermales bacterium]
MPLRFLLPLALLLVVDTAAAQLSAESGLRDTRASFQAELDDLRSKISATEKALNQTKNRESSSLRMLTQLNRDIALREEVVRTFEARIAQLTNERDSVFAQVEHLSTEIQALKEEYQARATHAYKYGRMHDLALIFSAASINQMLVRVNYLNRFSDARRKQVDEIRETTNILEDRRRDLLETLAYTEETLAEARQEREQLFDQKRERQRVVRALRQEKGKLETQLAQRRKAEEDLAGRLEALIAEERRRALAAGNTGFNAAEFAALTGSFETNRGRLPWPARGTVVERFGVQVNEEYGTRTTNQGIVVATTPAADVRSVFEGRVIGIDAMPVYGTYVMVSHGDYVTVYGNLSKVYVTPQQALTAGQLVGQAGTESDPYGAGYFFGLSKDGFVDPAAWLK